MTVSREQALSACLMVLRARAPDDRRFILNRAGKLAFIISPRGHEVAQVAAIAALHTPPTTKPTPTIDVTFIVRLPLRQVRTGISVLAAREHLYTPSLLGETSRFLRPTVCLYNLPNVRFRFTPDERRCCEAECVCARQPEHETIR